MAVTQALGQADLTTTNLTDIYTCPTGKVATVYVEACNRDNSTAATITVTLAPGGAATALSHHLRDELSIAASSFMQRLSITLAAGDVVRAQAGTANVLTTTVNGLLQDA